MFTMKRSLKIFLICIAVIIASGCDAGQKKSRKEAERIEAEIHAEFLKEQLEVCSVANQELAKINDKIRELNDKLHSKKIKLTDAQNEAIDEFEEKRAVLNRNLREIKNVSQDDWNTFKVAFENDLSEVKSRIDEILSGL